jgi:hypothetical protein
MWKVVARALMALALVPLAACGGGGGGHCNGIVVMNADGSGRRRITGPELYPSKRIAFSSNRAGKEDPAYGREVYASPGGKLLPPATGAPDVYVVGIDGRGLARLTDGASATYGPVW